MCVCVAMHNGSLPGWQRGERLRLITVNCRRRLRIQSEDKGHSARRGRGGAGGGQDSRQQPAQCRAWLE